MAAERLVVLNPDDELYPRLAGARRAPAARNPRTPTKTRSKPRAAAKPPARSTRNPTTGSTKMATAAKRKPAKKATVKARKAATPNPAATAKRKAAARKAVATRRKNAEVRSAAAKKAARTRQRNASRPATAKSPTRKPAARKPGRAPARVASPAKTRSAGRVPNPATFAGYKDSLKSAAQVGAVLLPLRAVINYLGAWPTAKDASGAATQTLGQRVGPLFDVGLSALALWAVPRFALKGGMAKYRQTTVAALNANLILSGIKTLAWYARRGWSADNAAIPAGDPAYPMWTNYIEFAEPQARTLQGAGGRVAGPRVAGRYQAGLNPRAGAAATLVYNRATGAYQPAAVR